MGSHVESLGILGLIIGIVFCQVVLAAGTIVAEDFETFDTAVWKVDRPDSFEAVDGILNVGRVYDLESADVYSAPCARLTSYDCFRFGKLTAKIRFAADLSGEHIYYFGFFNRDSWGKTFCWITSSGDTLTLQCRASKGKTVTVGAKGGFEQGKWYLFEIVWQADRVELLVDGESIGFTEDAEAIPDNHMPIVSDVYATDGSQIGMQIDYFNNSDTNVMRTSLPSTEVILPTNAELYPDLPSLVERKPTIRLRRDHKSGEYAEEQEITLDNTHYSLKLNLDKGVQIAELVNRYVGADCLAGRGSKLFAVEIDGVTVDSSHFEVVGHAVVAGYGIERKTLNVQLKSEKEQLEAVLGLGIDESANIVMDLELVNKANRDRVCHVVFPYVENIQIGAIEDNYYFYPHQAGWCGKAPYDLQEEYGLLCWTQVMSSFNRQLGGGLSTWVEDDSGAYKVLRLRKVERANYKPITFNSVHMKINEPDFLSESLEPGIMMAVAHNEKVLGAGRKMSLPPVVMAVHAGDWRYPLFEYKRWADQWYRHVGMPEWLKKDFNMVYVHDRLGNYGFTKGFYSKQEKRYFMAESIEEGREDHHLELALWWQYNEDPKINWGGLEKPMMGDYDYVEHWGGLEAFAEEISKCRARGSRVSLYMEVTQCWKETRIGKAHGKQWGRMDSPGNYNRDYCIAPDDGYIVCAYVAGWQDYVANRFARILAETGADAVRLDRGTLMYPCFNAEHRHYDGTAESAVPVERWVDLLNKVRSKLREVNPDAALFAEHAASDYLTQFYHGSTSQQFEWRIAEYEDKRVFNSYELMFFRYLFPEFKLYNWGQTFADGAKTSFFNAVGVDRSDLEPGEVYYYARTGKVLRESGDVFATLRPVPLVRTKVDYLYANKFSLKDRSVYTMYNKNADAVSGELIEVDHIEGTHYVDLFNDREVAAAVKDARAVLSSDIAAGEVIAVGQYPAILQVEAVGGKLVVRLKEAVAGANVRVIFGEDNKAGQLVEIHQGRGEIDIPQHDGETAVIVKLFSDDYLADEMVLN